MKKILSVEVRQPLQIVLSFDDGAEGCLDLSTYPRTGVFSAWDDPAFFSQVSVGQGGRSLEWPDEIDLCADSLWLELTGNSPESIYSGLKVTHA